MWDVLALLGIFAAVVMVILGFVIWCCLRMIPDDEDEYPTL